MGVSGQVKKLEEGGESNLLCPKQRWSLFTPVQLNLLSPQCLAGQKGCNRLVRFPKASTLAGSGMTPQQLMEGLI